AGLDGPGPVKGSRGISVMAESSLSDHAQESFDAVILPGGLGGTHRLRDSESVRKAVRAQLDAGRLTAAICAAPLALKAAGVLEGRRITHHPSVADDLLGSGAELTGERVVKDGQLFTSQGPGTAMEFALALVQELRGMEVASSVGAAMCVR
ncbi:MAG: DJ-1 family glyoxalase III, partial [Planctomycetota bacterium]